MQTRTPLLFLFGLCLSLFSAQAGTLAQFRTPFGDLDVELYDKEKPVTVENFKSLVRLGAYQNTFFHRLVPGFVAQGGGFWTTSKTNGAGFGPNWNYVGVVPNFGQITNEYSVGPKLSNTNGTIAMAKLGSGPNTATCQWFFNLANNSSLDLQNGGFTVFGHVVRDPNGLLTLFNNLSNRITMVDMSWWFPNDSVAASGLFSELPITTNTLPNVPPYSSLLYVDVSLLSVQVSVKGNPRTISWNSVSGRTNLVEYTTVMPPVWNRLVATNGNGTRFNVLDNQATNKFRFYRVRVLY
jgi:cyclophilin family peptidyl-prolyl cis-trans isomerase